MTEHAKVSLAREVVALPYWEWRDGMLHGEVDPNDGEFCYFERMVEGHLPRSRTGNPRLPALDDAATGGAMVAVYARHLRTTPVLTIALILDRLTGRNLDLSALSLGEACALAMLRGRP